MHAVEAQQMGIGLDQAEIVDGDHVDVLAAGLVARTMLRPIRPNPLMQRLTVMFPASRAEWINRL